MKRTIWIVYYQGEICYEWFFTKSEAKEHIRTQTEVHYTSENDYSVVKFVAQRAKERQG